MPIWPFRRRSREGAAEPTVAEPAVEGAPVPEPDVQRVAEATAATAVVSHPPTGAWRELPPLHATAGAFPLTAPVQRIAEGLTSLHKPDLALGQLGHRRSNDAPTGVVHGVLHPTAGTHAGTYASEAGLDVAHKPKPKPKPPAPAAPGVQRLRWGGQVATAPAPAGPPAAVAPAAVELAGTSPPVEPPVAVHRVADDAPAAVTASPLPVAIPARPVPAIDRPAPGPSGPLPIPVVRAHRPGAPSVQPSGQRSAPQGVQDAAQRPGAAGAPVSPLVGAAPLVQRVADDAAPTATPVDGPVPAPAAPLVPHVVPPAAHAQRVPEASPAAAPLTPTVAPGAAGAPAAPAARVTATPAPQVPDAAPAGEAPLVGARRVVRRRLGEPLAQRPSTAGVAGADLPVAVQRVPESGSAGRVASFPVPAPMQPISRRIASVPAGAEAPATPVPKGFGGAPGAPLVGLTSIGLQRVAETDEVAAPPVLDSDGWPVPPPPKSTLRPSEPVKPLLTSGARVPSGGAPAPVPVRRGGGAQRTAVGEQVTAPPPGGGPGGEPGGGSPLALQRAPETVPHDLAEDLLPVLGTDVSRVPVHRGPEVGAAATQLQAKAFTTGGEVHLPDKIGSTSSGEGRDVLAHELTHVGQQQRLGSALPAEDSPAGQVLEHEAKQVAGALQTPKAQRVPAQGLAAQSVGAQRLDDDGLSHPTSRAGWLGGSTPLTGPAALAMVQHVQRAAAGSSLATIAPTPVGGVSFPSASPTDHGGPVSLGVQRAVQIDEVSVSATGPDTQQAPRGQGSEPVAQGPQDLDKLADDLYDRIARKLRRDLLRQRERAGMLSDLR